MMPAAKKITVAHFKKVSKGRFPIENGIALLWISPEQSYYKKSDAVKAMFDLINKTFDHRTCEIWIVIADTLQRFNFYQKNYTEEGEQETASAYQSAKQLGIEWWESTKAFAPFLKSRYTVYHWEDFLNTPEYGQAKLAIDQEFSSNPGYAEPFDETAAIAARAAKKTADTNFIDNSREYLREECAFLHSLQLNPAKLAGRQLCILYPNSPSPAISATYKRFMTIIPMPWLAIDLKERDLTRISLREVEEYNGHCGISLNIDKAMSSPVIAALSPQVNSLFFACPPGQPTNPNPNKLSTSPEERIDDTLMQLDESLFRMQKRGIQLRKALYLAKKSGDQKEISRLIDDINRFNEVAGQFRISPPSSPETSPREEPDDIISVTL